MRYYFLLLISLFIPSVARAAEVVYQIEEYNQTEQDFRLKTYGIAPWGSYAYFVNEYGATAGNRYNQIPKNKEARLTLVGFEGCRIDSVTLSLCSNNKAGALRLQVTSGDSVLFTMPTRDFSSADWYGAWLSKDLGMYADITKCMQSNYMVKTDEDVTLLLKTGNDGSMYVKRFVVYYTPIRPIHTQNPMGYVYEKLEKKSVLNAGDTVIFYRSGDAAGDWGGMDEARYLDAIGVASTSDVYEQGISHFVLHPAGSAWQLISIEGDTLCAKGAQHLAWNAGVHEWTIELTYNGAEISPVHTGYGMLRYNAPAGSYARFWNYTSTSLPLPYLYRRLRQNQPIAVSEVQLPDYRLAYLENDTIALRPTLLPKNVTDERVRWQSADTTVATVHDGVLRLRTIGTTTITCTSWDGLHTASCVVDVQHQPSALTDVEADHTARIIYHRGRILLQRGRRFYDLLGNLL